MLSKEPIPDVVLGLDGNVALILVTSFDLILCERSFVNFRFGSKAVIASVTGTETDPQGYSRKVKTRRAAGVLVAASNAAAASSLSDFSSILPATQHC